MMLSITQLEEAINRWRRLKPATTTNCALCSEASELATIYALMILGSETDLDLERLTEAQINLITQVLGPLNTEYSDAPPHSKAA